MNARVSKSCKAFNKVLRAIENDPAFTKVGAGLSVEIGPGQQPTLFVVDYVSAYCFAENALVSESVEVIVSNLECQSQ